MAVSLKQLKKMFPDWKIYQYSDEGSFDLSGYSPEGENIVVTISGSTFAELARDAAVEHERFDADDHAAQIYHAKHYGSDDEQRFFAGAPEKLKDLLKDARAIKRMLKEVAMALEVAANGKDKVQK